MCGKTGLISDNKTLETVSFSVRDSFSQLQSSIDGAILQINIARPARPTPLVVPANGTAAPQPLKPTPTAPVLNTPIAAPELQNKGAASLTPTLSTDVVSTDPRLCW